MINVVCVFPVIRIAIDKGLISVDDIAKTLKESESYIIDRLSGIDDFDINEAMTINNSFFSDVPFKELFSKDTTKVCE